MRYAYELADGRQRNYVDMTPAQEVWFGLFQAWEHGPKTAQRRAQLHKTADKVLDYFDALSEEAETR